MMKGTEKQIAWAEDIINNARQCIDNNIAYINTLTDNNPLKHDLPIWERLQVRFAEAVAHPKMQDASFVISNRNNKIFHPQDIIGMVTTMTHNGIALEDAIKRTIG